MHKLYFGAYRCFTSKIKKIDLPQDHIRGSKNRVNIPNESNTKDRIISPVHIDLISNR